MRDVIESGEFSWDTLGGSVVRKGSLGVSSRGQLRVHLEETNEKNNLNLGGERKGIPLLRRREVGAREGISLKGHGPRELEVALDAVSNEGGHGNTSVLDLGVTEEVDDELLTLSPQVTVSNVQRIVESNDRVELLGEDLKVGLFCSIVLDTKY